MSIYENVLITSVLVNKNFVLNKNVANVKNRFK